MCFGAFFFKAIVVIINGKKKKEKVTHIPALSRVCVRTLSQRNGFCGATQPGVSSLQWRLHSFLVTILIPSTVVFFSF